MDDPHSISRASAARLGVEAVAIAKQGRYTAPTGTRVEIGALVSAAVEGTRSFPPDAPVPRPGPGRHETRIEVRRESTLSAASRLLAEGHDVVALNFASARHPGGGFLSGARAQEESLCRSSALYACLEGNPMYEWHARRPDPLYGSWVVHSPKVPVFRDDEGLLLKVPWCCSFITSPAPMAKELKRQAPERLAEIEPALAERIARVLAVAAGHDAVVLGAWGCGAFGCDPVMVAGLFAKALSGPFRDVFARVLFAILDTTPERRFVGPFEPLTT
jgi:uncharacterized protein (TIGR02452 family)